MSERMKVLYVTITGDNTLELPTPLDVEGYLCGLVEIAGKVVNLKGDLFLCCDFCEESIVGEIKLPVLHCIKRKQTGIVYNDINHVIWLQVIRPNISSIRLYIREYRVTMGSAVIGQERSRDCSRPITALPIVTLY